MSDSRKSELNRILTEAKSIQDRFKGQSMPQNEGEKFEALCIEAKAIQDEFERESKLRKIESGARVVDEPVLPSATKAADKGSPDEIVGYVSLGEAVTKSAEWAQFKARGFQSSGDFVMTFAGGSFLIDRSGKKFLQHGIVPVTRKDLESKAVPTLGASVISPTRIAETVRFAQQDRLQVRSLLNISQTDSNAIEYTTMSASTRAAAPVADSALKPEAAMTLGTATAPVRTIAVWIPITEQQLQDLPQLQNIINVELTWDLGKTEEEQVLWGSGTGQNLLGIFQTPGVAAGRTVGGDTVIDQVRRMITDILVAGLEPNGVVMDPMDFETAVLAKGTDNRYIWSVVTEDNVHRLWSLPVVETVAAREPGAYTTNERRVLVGDFIRGATLWDRQQAGVSVGWKNDDFIRNLRTIRAEERLAFGVKRPAAFRYRITQARVA